MTAATFWLLIVLSTLGLYAVKVVALVCVPNRWAALGLFLSLLPFQILGLYAINPDYPSPDCDPKSHWIGLPAAFLTVPTLSFLLDWQYRKIGFTQGYVSATLCELFIVTPLWFIAWVAAEIFLLGWIWI